MAQEFIVKCPQCDHKYNVHKMVYDKGPDFEMLCPLCLHRYPRKEGKIESSNFPLTE